MDSGSFSLILILRFRHPDGDKLNNLWKSLCLNPNNIKIQKSSSLLLICGDEATMNDLILFKLGLVWYFFIKEFFCLRSSSLRSLMFKNISLNKSLCLNAIKS